MRARQLKHIRTRNYGISKIGYRGMRIGILRFLGREISTEKTKENLMKTSLRKIVIAVSFLFAALPALAHHSFTSEFDINQPVDLKGTITKFDWVNPHG